MPTLLPEGDDILFRADRYPSHPSMILPSTRVWEDRIVRRLMRAKKGDFPHPGMEHQGSDLAGLVIRW